ncbi:MAG TPA: hypothetical protein VIN39_07945 [Candidatus Dormibacteraeota bacterium]
MAVHPLTPLPEPSQAEATLDVELFATAVSWVSLAAVRIVLLAAAVFFVAGWLYLTAFYGFFRMPLGGLGVSPAEILLNGVHSLLFPLAVMLPIFFLRIYARRLMLLFILMVAGSAALLALLAFAFHWYSATDVIVQTAAVLWIGLAVLGIQQGFGRENRWHKLILAGAALLLVISVPTAFGIIDAGQQATATRTHFMLVTSQDLGLPGGTKMGDRIEYRNFALLRETDSRYWLMRVGLADDVFSVAKSQVLFVRY